MTTDVTCCQTAIFVRVTSFNQRPSYDVIISTLDMYRVNGDMSHKREYVQPYDYVSCHEFYREELTLCWLMVQTPYDFH